MELELARKRPATVVSQQNRAAVAVPIRVRPALVADVRPLVPPAPRGLARALSPADWPWSVVIAVHAALAAGVVMPVAWVASVLG